MFGLPLELKILIARLNKETWVRMWRYDHDFHKYSESESGRRLFIGLFTTAEVNSFGCQTWRLFDKLHRNNDLPAVIYKSGSQEWWVNGVLHRDNDLAAVIWVDGDQEWYQNGLIHRNNDLPSVIRQNGTKLWYKNGRLHRDNDLPAIILSDGSQSWWKDDNLHREGGLPAIINADGYKAWIQNGLLHGDNKGCLDPNFYHLDPNRQVDKSTPFILQADGSKLFHYYLPM